MPTQFDNIVPNATAVTSAVTSYRPLTGRPHEGVDIFASAGSAIYSPRVNGVVVVNTTNNTSGQFGNYMVIRTLMEDGVTPVFTVYGHLQKVPINPNTGVAYAKNDPIPANTQFGMVGNSGFNLQGQPYKIHLHYEERLGTPGLLSNWKGVDAFPVDPKQNFFGYSGGTPNTSAITSGISPTGIPGAASDPGMHYVETTSPTQTGRLYDNGVSYTLDTQTGNQYWSIPTSTGGIQDTTQFASGQVTAVQYNFDPNAGKYILDTTSSNVQQYLQQQTLSLPTSGLGTQNLQAWQTAYQALSDAINNDPNARASVDANGAVAVNAGGSVYGITGGVLIQYTTGTNGQQNGLSILAGSGAGQTFTYTLDGSPVITDAQAIELGGKMLSNLASTGTPIGIGGGLSLDNFNGIVNATVTQTGTADVIANLTYQSVWDGGNRLGTIMTRYDVATSVYTQTVDTTLNGNTVNVTYTYDAVTGDPVPHVNSINGVAPTDPAAADAAFKQTGILPGQLMYGDMGTSGTGASGVVSAFDAVHPTGAQTLANVINQYGGTLIDALTLVKAIQSGDPLPVTVSGLRLANALNTTNGVPASYTLSGAANVGGGILSLMSLDAALQRGDTLGAITAGAQTLSFGTQAYANLALNNSANLAGGSTQAMYEFLNGTAKFDSAGNLLKAGDPGVLPYLNLVNSIANGDGVGAALGALQIANSAGWMAVPGIGEIVIAYTVFNMVTSLFSDNAPPEAWGSASATWSGFNAVANATGAYGGLESATNTYNGVLSYLDQLVAQEQAVNPGAAIGIVANRLPSLSYRNYTGYSITDIDPLTGEQRNPGTLYDLTGRPYNAPAGSVQASQSLSERMIRVALERGAVAPLWEVQTAALQTQMGDPMAGLTEEERAGRAGLLAPSPAAGATSQMFRAVALDLNGDGVQTTGAARTVAFDVDDSGYLKNTAWLNNNDGFLFLDRNLNGQIDAGSELFSNSAVALSERGLNGMRWIDSNYDGSLSALDPVWDELKVWQDANGNGAADAGEVKTLAQIGITALNYAMGTFERNGQLSQLASPDLAADTEGTITYTVPEGIIVQTSNGKTSLLATRIDDKSVIEANRDGVTGYEDTELIISAADLLANDTLAGFSGNNLSITGVSGFTHGSGFLDGNGFVHYTPDANYFGAAQLEYNLQAATGRAANDEMYRRAA